MKGYMDVLLYIYILFIIWLIKHAFIRSWIFANQVLTYLIRPLYVRKTNKINIAVYILYNSENKCEHKFLH